MKINGKLIGTVVVIVLALVLLKGINYLNSHQKEPVQEATAPVLTIDTAAVATVDKTENLSLTGDIEAKTDALISAKIGAR